MTIPSKGKASLQILSRLEGIVLLRPGDVLFSQVAETSSTDAASDARVTANQNLPGLAVVGQIVFVGVSHCLENMETYLVRAEHKCYLHT